MRQHIRVRNEIICTVYDKTAHFTNIMYFYKLFAQTKFACLTSCVHLFASPPPPLPPTHKKFLCGFVDENSLRTVPTNSEVFLRGLLNVRGKQILTSVIEIQKENWGNQPFSEDN